MLDAGVPDTMEAMSASLVYLLLVRHVGAVVADGGERPSISRPS
jgi:hypothetical protein